MQQKMKMDKAQKDSENSISKSYDEKINSILEKYTRKQRDLEQKLKESETVRANVKVDYEYKLKEASMTQEKLQADI